MRSKTRDRDSKTRQIIEATLQLINKKGYLTVTAREIAQEAGVSIGLIYKYFPEGKQDILREIGRHFVREILQFRTQEPVDFLNFPGFLKMSFSATIAHERQYEQLYRALTMASLSDRMVLGGFEDIPKSDREEIIAFFLSFRGINVDRFEDPWPFIARWLDLINGAILHHLMYPSAFTSDEELVGMLVEISLKLWGFDEKY